MERDDLLWFTPVDHPDPRVQRVGFDLDDPYVEQCWSAVIGPSSVLLLRRLPVLWVAEVPARIATSELSQSIGLGAGVGERSRLANTLDRVVRFGLARPATDSTGLDVYRQVPPLSPRQVQRSSTWTRTTHERLFAAHLQDLAGRGDLAGTVASLRARMDRLENTRARSLGTLGR